MKATLFAIFLLLTSSAFSQFNIFFGDKFIDWNVGDSTLEVNLQIGSEGEKRLSRIIGSRSVSFEWYLHLPDSTALWDADSTTKSGIETVEWLWKSEEDEYVRALNNPRDTISVRICLKTFIKSIETWNNSQMRIVVFLPKKAATILRSKNFYPISPDDFSDIFDFKF